ncbi:MAG: hypothetical protein E7033_04335 [Akkermansiaceae bacterium]|nr:hypothetical protein [Akkermansiaceae bacterium]
MRSFAQIWGCICCAGMTLTAQQAESILPTAQELRQAQQNKEPDEHVVSQSRMFSVSGGDSLRMGAIATKADEIRGRVNSLFGFQDDFKYTISIRLIGQSTDKAVARPIRTRISIIGNEPNFQIRIYPGGGIDVERLSNAIITMLLYERALREVRPDALPESVKVPEWLVTGVQQAILWKSGKADRRMYRKLFEKAEMMSPEDIVSIENASRLDAATREMYEVSCGVLMMCLVTREGGQAQLRELVAESILTDGAPVEIIASHFHELGIEKNMFNRWWALQLAAMADMPATEMLTPVETEQQLREAITILQYDQETRTSRPISLDNAYALLEVPDWRTQMKPLMERLAELSIHAFPGYQPIIREYQHVVSELLNGKSADDVQQILGPIRELREAYITTSIRARDYLDWYEITHLGASPTQGSFATYREVLQMLRKEDTGPDTPLSRYLQDIELLHQLKEKEPLPEPIRTRIPQSTPKTTASHEKK